MHLVGLDRFYLLVGPISARLFLVLSFTHLLPVVSNALSVVHCLVSLCAFSCSLSFHVELLFPSRFHFTYCCLNVMLRGVSMFCGVYFPPRITG